MTTGTTPKRNRVFISYSRKDRDWVERVRLHLRPLERDLLADVWDDSEIEAGDDWMNEIKNAVARRAHPKRLARLLMASTVAAFKQLRHARRPLETYESGPREVVLEKVNILITGETVSEDKDIAAVIRLLHENQQSTAATHSLLVIAGGSKATPSGQFLKRGGAFTTSSGITSRLCRASSRASTWRWRTRRRRCARARRTKSRRRRT